MIRITGDAENELREALAALHSMLADMQKYHAKMSAKLMMLEERINKALDSAISKDAPKKD